MNRNNRGFWKRLITLSLLVFLLIGSLSACGSNHPVVGTWEGRMLNGEPLGEFVFRANGTMIAQEQRPSGSVPVEGRYEIHGNRMSWFLSDGVTQTFTFRIVDDIMTFDGMSVQFTRMSSGFGSTVLILLAIFAGIGISLYLWKKYKAATANRNLQ
ncbi:MAG: hypothetical protein FWE12_03485 [Oscillospiraceae bacterium]|nr:hypothetical protein [Oscillospiraceae bacterium]